MESTREAGGEHPSGGQTGTGHTAPVATGRERARVIAVCGGLLLVGGGCVAAFVANWNSPLRTVVALAFLLFVPGLALAELLQIEGALQRLALAVGVSLAIETLVAIALVYAGIYSTGLVLAVVAALSTAALVTALVRRLHSGGPKPPPSAPPP